MRQRFYFSLLLTCLAISAHFAIEGVQSRAVTQVMIEQSAPTDLLGGGFATVWMILSGIELALLALAHRIALARPLRVLTYICGLIYLGASLFAYLGYLELQSRVLI